MLYRHKARELRTKYKKERAQQKWGCLAGWVVIYFMNEIKNLLGKLDTAPTEYIMRDSSKIIWSCTKDNHRCNTEKKWWFKSYRHFKEERRPKKTLIEIVRNDLMALIDKIDPD